MVVFTYLLYSINVGYNVVIEMKLYSIQLYSKYISVFTQNHVSVPNASYFAAFPRDFHGLLSQVVSLSLYNQLCMT